jgi:hypothetical protein
MLRARRFDVDLAHPAATARRAWLLLGLGLAVFATVAVHAYRVHDQRALVAMEQSAVAASMNRWSASGTAAVSRTTKQDPAQRASFSEARQLVRQLHRPWMELLDGLDRTADSQVRLRHMAIDPRFELLTIEVEAASMRDVLGYTQRLATAPQVRQARLVSFEQRADGDGRLVARLSATLDTAASAPQASREASGTTRVHTAQSVAPQPSSP